MQIATGWTAFANGGHKVQPYLIQRIDNRHGEPLFIADPVSVAGTAQVAEVAATSEEAMGDAESSTAQQSITPQAKEAERILDERTAYIMTSMLQDVIKRGTGHRAMALNRTDLAGKTGTTNDSKDSWFSGYNADLVTTVWAGFDQPESLGRHEYGGTVALPIWMRYMGTALKDKPNHAPAEPEGILSLRIDPHSGRAATPSTPGAYFELFKSEDSPPSMQEFDSETHVPGSPLPAEEAAPIDLF